MKLYYLNTITLLFLMLPSSQAASNSLLNFENAWIAEAPPVSKVMAAYVIIHNPDDSSREITSVSSPCFENIEIHRSTNENGMARMVYLPSLVIPASGKITLEPGSYHMMLFNPKKKLTSGDQCQLSFQLADKKTLNTTAIVKKSETQNSDGHHHH